MTHTLLSLVSILIGILGAIFLGFLKPKYTLGITSNVISGVFASIFVIKSFGRLGFTPNHIITHSQINYGLLILNLTISFTAGVLGLIVISTLKNKLPN